MDYNNSRKTNNEYESGLSLLEVLISISVIGLLSVIIFLSFHSIQNSDALSKNAVGVVALYENARSNTLASLEGEQYGVYATSSSLVLFKGSVYNEEDPLNEIFDLSGGVFVKNIELNDGGSSVVFERLTGRALSIGTTTLGVGDGALEKTIVINRTGTINLGD